MKKNIMIRSVQVNGVTYVDAIDVNHSIDDCTLTVLKKVILEIIKKYEK